MHPSMHYELMNARTADRRRETERARAVAQARHAQRQHGTARRGHLAQHLFRVLRGWQPSRDTVC